MIEYRAWIFTLGNEVVQGRVLNTNAAFIGRRLTLLGLKVVGVVSLIDDVDTVARYLAIALEDKPKIIVTTGGLGPTHDDRTLEAVAIATKRSLALNMDALEMLKSRYRALGQELTAERIKMAYLPEGAIPIPNPIGSAPGSWLEVGGSVIVSLPGVPREMEAMWVSWVEPRLKAMIPARCIVEKTFRVIDVPEALLAPIVKEVVNLYPGVYIKTHPIGDELGKQAIDVYVMYLHEDRDAAKKTVEEVVGALKSRFRERYGYELKVTEEEGIT